jgi:assimilatory nitrate reductase catalytic subunit
MLSIQASTGQAIAHAKLDDSQRIGECFMPIHWNKSYASHANVSALYKGIVDPVSGQPECKQGAINLSKKHFKQYVSLHTSTAMNDLESVTHFWLKNTASYGEAYQAAFNEPVNDELLWCQQVTHLSGEWLQFHQGKTVYIICLQAGKLVALAYFSQQWPAIENSWLEHVFGSQTLEFSTIQSLLLGIASDEFNQGKQVCSCFNVGEKTINEAIAQGCASVEQLGEKLQCGTKCGSCKPELSSLLSKYSIPVLQV